MLKFLGKVGKGAFNVLGDVAGMTVPGQRWREMKDEERLKEALATGDPEEVAKYNPQLARQMVGLDSDQEGLEQTREENSRGDQEIVRQAAMRASRAIRALEERGIPRDEAFDRIANASGSLFGTPEQLGQFKEFFTQNEDPYKLIEESLMGAEGPGLMQVGRNIFDPATREWIMSPEQTSAAPDNQDWGASGGFVYNKNTGEVRKMSAGAEPGGSVKERTQTEGIERLQQVLGDTLQAHVMLYEADGAVSPGQGLVKNARNYVLAKTFLGDVVRVGGGEEAEKEEIRNTIENRRPLILQSIMQATGMSARSLDSNRELEFYLQAASDPAAGFTTNVAALDTLSRIFGAGSILDKVELPEDVRQKVRSMSARMLEENPISIEKLREADTSGAPDAPPGDLPDDVKDAWDYLTDEDKQLWLN